MDGSFGRKDTKHHAISTPMIQTPLLTITDSSLCPKDIKLPTFSTSVQITPLFNL